MKIFLSLALTALASNLLYGQTKDLTNSFAVAENVQIQEITNKTEAADTIETYNKLIKIDLQKFVGKTVGELLQNDTVKLYYKITWMSHPPGKLASMMLEYARGLYLEIEANPLQHKQFSLLGKYDIEKFKKEKITKIAINKWYFDVTHKLQRTE